MRPHRGQIQPRCVGSSATPWTGQVGVGVGPFMFSPVGCDDLFMIRHPIAARNKVLSLTARLYRSVDACDGSGRLTEGVDFELELPTACELV